METGRTFHVETTIGFLMKVRAILFGGRFSKKKMELF